ncbi:Nuclease-related domain [Staphylococcus piscifermentans]|uniref:Uncharacterized protein n=1 Tax=Staphylococcus piscifermentans TaxID=70258 RepID=A0A239TMT1_9STAP|nr:nuclease-related domain-containing protein [Staphylococcus piscifermentans]RTX84123.1 NERD domain-containing protein [Staphylococcus piscifermentans]GEP84464.1 hypothetical protein SPI02_10490 [Staphylococcus piscifermentans]SNU99050.1 Nuclease-related domain [Staphylococcus piscifermentans]
MTTNTLEYLQALEGRCQLSDTEQAQFNQITKGQEGETLLATALDNVPDINYIADLQLGEKYHETQIDFVVLTPQSIFLIENKHYQSSYQFTDGHLYSRNHKRVDNPFLQMHDARECFMHHFPELSHQFKIMSILTFSHPQFSLRGDLSAQGTYFLPNEFHQFKHLFSYGKTPKLLFIKKQILSKNTNLEEKYMTVKRRPLHEVASGIKCPHCKKIILECGTDISSSNYIVCSYCHSSLKKSALIYAALKDLYLIKGEPITSREARHWIGDVGISRHSIYTILKKNFKSKGDKFYIHYFL